VLRGKSPVLEIDYSTVTISNETWMSEKDWCEKVVWFGNRQGAYIHNYQIQKEGVTSLAYG